MVHRRKRGGKKGHRLHEAEWEESPQPVPKEKKNDRTTHPVNIQGEEEKQTGYGIICYRAAKRWCKRKKGSQRFLFKRKKKRSNTHILSGGKKEARRGAVPLKKNQLEVTLVHREKRGGERRTRSRRVDREKGEGGKRKTKNGKKNYHRLSQRRIGPT